MSAAPMIGELVQRYTTVFEAQQIDFADRVADQILSMELGKSLNLFNDEDGIAGLLDRGRVVISDRYFYSSLSYQGVTEDMSWLRSINDFPHPQYVIFVDTPAAECMKRIDSRGGEKELFDRIDYLERVRSNFNIVFETLPDGVKFLKVDGMEPVEVQADRIASFVSL